MYQIFLVLAIIFPSMLMVITFRFFYPKTKFIPINNFFLLLPMMIVVCYVNIDLIIAALREVLVMEKQTCPNCPNILSHLNLLSSLTPEKNFPWNFFRCLTNIVSSGESLLSIIFKIHLRSWSLVILFSIFHKILEWATNNLEDKKYVGIFHKLLKYTLTQLHNRIFHTWVLHNKKTKVLMVDIFMNDGNLYSGKFNDFTANNGEISTISLSNIFRYHPSNAGPDHHLKPTADGEEFKSNRKQRLVNNRGKLIIPYSEIKTIHIWEIKIGTIIRINISDHNSEEKFKWYYSLILDNPHIFKKLLVYVFYKSVDKDLFQKRMSSWIRHNDIDTEKITGKITLEYINTDNMKE